MTLTILGIVGTLLGLFAWWIRRRSTKRDDPIEQNRLQHERTAREIIQDDADGANESLAGDVERLRALQGPKRGQDGPEAEGR